MNARIHDGQASTAVRIETQVGSRKVEREESIKIGRRIVQFLGTFIESARRAREQKANYHALHSLDDRMLKDIGIGRSDIRAIARGVWDDARD